MTIGHDAQRSSWVRMDAKIAPETMSKPGFELIWKYQLKGASTPPSLLDFYISYRGFRTLGFFGSQNNVVTGIDTDIARLEWEKVYPVATTREASTPMCPGGMTAAVTRPTGVAIPPPLSGRGVGRGTPAKSGVGEAGAGAVTIRKTTGAPPPPPKPAPAPPKPAAAPESSPFAPRVQYANAITSDGQFHSLWVSNGNEPNPAIPFLPRGANARGLIVVNGVAYVSTINGCQGVPNGIWALDLASKTVKSWKADIAGTYGPAFGPDGTLYATTTAGEVAALTPGTLELKSSFRAPSLRFSSSPSVFEFRGKILLAATSQDGKLNIFDTASLSSSEPLAQSPAFATPGYNVGALSTWQDPAGTRWFLVPTGSAIAAWKLTENAGAFKLERGWSSPSLLNPMTPIVVNAVVFALAGGDAKTPAVLHALDSLTGKSVWNSGSSIAGPVSLGGLAAGGSRVYVSTPDGTQYVFGFPIEH